VRQEREVEERERYERAFVALSYALGCRNAELSAPLSVPSPAARDLAEKLCHPQRSIRAAVLAAELARVAHALESRRIV
jgi:hypothetical protein